ncbi:MAG TPA: hypothetical protein DEO65_08680 [Bacillus bacterium]|nr:hypothetical protein [Bacillus sp. (in: firmicutes)]
MYQRKENHILYGGFGTGKTYLATLISLNAIHGFGSQVSFYTVACLVNQLIEAHQEGKLPKLMNVFGDPLLTEAVIDRLIHHSHLLLFTDDCFRYKEPLLHS